MLGEMLGDRVYMELVDKAYMCALHRHNLYLWREFPPAPIDFEQMIERLRLGLVGYNPALVWLRSISV